MGMLLDILGGVGDVLDTPGRFTRTALAGRNPFAAVFDPSKGVSGRDLLQQYGMVGENQDGLDAGDVGGFLAEMALDPTNLTGGGLLARVMGKASKAKAANRGIEAANDLAAAENRAMALAPRGIRAAEEAPIARSIPQQADRGIRGYLPDRSQETIKGSRNRVIRGDDILGSNRWHRLAAGLAEPNSPIEELVALGKYSKGDFIKMNEKKLEWASKGPPYHESRLPVEAQVQFTGNQLFDEPGTPPTVYMDAFKGLNAGHALKRAAANLKGNGDEVRLIRVLPKKFRPDDLDDVADLPGELSKLMNRNDIEREAGLLRSWPYKNNQAEKAFVPSSLVEKLAAALKNEQSRVTRIPPSNEFVKELQALQKIPSAKPLLAELLGQNVMARFNSAGQQRSPQGF